MGVWRNPSQLSHVESVLSMENKKPLENCQRFHLRSFWQQLGYVHTANIKEEGLSIPSGFRSLMIPSGKKEREQRSFLPECSGVSDTQCRAPTAGLEVRWFLQQTLAIT